MPIAFHEFATIVTAAPGTGSTSLLAACDRSALAVDLVDALGLGDADLDPKHATVADLARTCAFTWEGEIVTTTRNPFDFYLAEWTRTRTRWAREVDDPTSWVHRVAGMRRAIDDAVENDFVDWLELVLGADVEAGTRRRVNRGHVDEATIIVRMEHFDQDLERAHPDLAREIGTLPHENRTDRSRDTAAAYTPRARDLVATVHAEDIDRFGYDI